MRQTLVPVNVTPILPGRLLLSHPVSSAKRRQGAHCQPCEQRFEVRRRSARSTVSALLGHSSLPDLAGELLRALSGAKPTETTHLTGGSAPGNTQPEAIPNFGSRSDPANRMSDSGRTILGRSKRMSDSGRMILSLADRMSDFGRVTSGLADRMSDLGRMILGLADRMSDLGRMISGLANRMSDLGRMISDLANRMSDSGNVISDLRIARLY